MKNNIMKNNILTINKNINIKFGNKIKSLYLSIKNTNDILKNKDINEEILKLIKKDQKILIIDSIEVKNKYRGEGEGTLLVKSIINQCKNQNINYIYIDAYKKSVGFWEKQGFILSKTYPISYGVTQDFKPGILVIK